MSCLVKKPVYDTALTLEESEMKIVEFANSIDLDEVAHNEQPHLSLHCLLLNL